MAKPKKGRGLGKGLGAIFHKENLAEVQRDAKQKSTIKISTKDIVPNPHQPRLHFDKNALETLMHSIKQYGLVQPVVVRKVDDKYELVAGERRWRACKLLNLKEIDAIVKDYSTEQTSEIALVENLQRQDLDPIEEACAYQRLKDTFKLTQEEIAERIGRSRSHIANILRLLKLPEFIQNKLSAGDISIGQARPLLMLKSDDLQQKMLDKITDEDLNARQIEALVKEWNDPKPKTQKVSSKKEDSAELRQWQDRLKLSLGTPVDIKLNRGKKVKGKIEIKFTSEDELIRLLQYLEDTHTSQLETNNQAPKKELKNFIV